jgi:hypothetical protein
VEHTAMNDDDYYLRGNQAEWEKVKRRPRRKPKQLVNGQHHIDACKKLLAPYLPPKKEEAHER